MSLIQTFPDGGGGGSDVTFTLYSATQDTVTISQNGTTVETVTIASGNSADVTLPKGRYTFTSSIAKNPDDLSAFYSKDVAITPAVIDVYLMPDNVCYWYGYKSSEYEIISAANGYTWGSYSYTFLTPTESTNKITCNAPAGSQACGIAFKNAITGSTAKAIVQGVSNYSGSIYGALYLNNTKSIAVDNAIASSTIENTSIHLKTLNISGNTSKILVLDVYNTRKIDVYALWYDASETDVSTKADKTDIAPVENGTTASRAYAVGQQFYLNGSLYKAKTAIAQGATFTIGTNSVLAGCVTEQIKNISVDYSTTEHIVGTWTTGETLYEITLTKTEPNSTEHYIDVTSLNIKNVVYIDAVRIDSSANMWPANANRGNNPWSDYQYVGTSKRITFYKSAGTAWQTALLVCTIRYTKNS